MKITLIAGPLCRYYARGGGDTPESLVEPVLGWRRFITPQFRSAGVMSMDWCEDPTSDVRELCVDQSSYWSLRLLGAYDQCPKMPRPNVAPESPASDPAMIVIRDHFLKTKTPHLHACDLWLPVRAAEPVEVQTPTEAIKPVGSVAMLKAEVLQLSKRVLGCLDANALRQASGESSRSELERQGAAFAAELLDLCEFATSGRVPIAAGFEGVEGVA
ncbi:MAG: hypothetical protein ACK54H_07975 [Phycisphaerales bacterium]